MQKQSVQSIMDCMRITAKLCGWRDKFVARLRQELEIRFRRNLACARARLR